MFQNIRTLTKVFSAYRWHLLGLVCLASIAALLEGVGINATIPLLSFFMGAGGTPTDPISKLLQGLFGFLHIPFSFRYILVFIILLFLLRAIFMSGYAAVRGWVTADFITNETRRSFKGLLQASWSYLLKQKTGYIQSILTRDTQRTMALLEMGTQVIQSATGLLMYLIVASTISPLMTAVAFGGALFVLFAMRPFLRRTVQGGATLAVAEKHIVQFLSEHLNGMKLVKASGVVQEALSYSETMLAQLRSSYIRIAFSRSIAVSAFQPTALVFIGILFLVMYRLPGFNIISFAATLYLIQKMFLYAESAQTALHGSSEIIPYVETVAKLKDELTAAKENKGTGTKPFVFAHKLELKDVTLSYGEKKALDRVSFSAPRGHTVGLAGPSGAGKTSVADILLRLFVPGSGELLLDGVPASDIEIDAWRHKVAYVPQEVFLLNASIEDNIRFYRQDISHEDIVEALKHANIFDLVQSLPEGLQSNVGDRGVLLSGGQRQRIALARALAGKPEVLVLDEATSALDAESEKLIQEVLGNLHGSMTVFIIAHRLSTIRTADQIFVLEDGRIVESGNPKELWANPDSYVNRHTA